MGEWKFTKQQIVNHRYNIYQIGGNFLKNDAQFRGIRPDKNGKCELCDDLFVDGEYMHLALNKGKGGNLLICDKCKDEAVENGVECNCRKIKD